MWKIVRSALQEKTWRNNGYAAALMLGICSSSDFWWFFWKQTVLHVGHIFCQRSTHWKIGNPVTTGHVLNPWQTLDGLFKKHRYVKHDISSTLTILYIVLNQSCRAVINWQIIETTLIYFDLSCVFFPNILGVSFPTTSGHDMPWSRAPWNTSRARTSFAETMEKPFLFSSFAFCLSTSSTKNPRPRDLYMFLFW